MSIQPANKEIEHLINSYDWYWERKQKQSMLILYSKNSKEDGGGGGYSHKQSEGLGRVLWVHKGPTCRFMIRTV